MLVALIGASPGVGLSIIPRLELALPGLIPSSSLQYNSCISFHGILMTPFMITPLLIGGFGNLLVPLMLCSCDTIFHYFPAYQSKRLKSIRSFRFIWVEDLFNRTASLM